jgi:hypothetical protein
MLCKTAAAMETLMNRKDRMYLRLARQYLEAEKGHYWHSNDRLLWCFGRYIWKTTINRVCEGFVWGMAVGLCFGLLSLL